MKELNKIVKELACGIACCEKDYYPRCIEHPDYNKRQDAFIVENEEGDLFEVKVSKL